MNEGIRAVKVYLIQADVQRMDSSGYPVTIPLPDEMLIQANNVHEATVKYHVFWEDSKIPHPDTYRVSRLYISETTII